MRFALLFTALASIAGCTREQAPEIPDGPVAWSVSASSTTPVVQVGDDFTFTLTLTHPPEGDFVPPSAAEFEPFVVLETWSESVSPVETKLHFRLAAYQLPEDLEVAPLELIRYRDEAGEMASAKTEPIAVSVVTSLTADVTDIHDIKDPMALSGPARLELAAPGSSWHFSRASSPTLFIESSGRTPRTSPLPPGCRPRGPRTKRLKPPWRASLRRV